MTRRQKGEKKGLKTLKNIVKSQVFVTQESWLRNCTLVI